MRHWLIIRCIVRDHARGKLSLTCFVLCLFMASNLYAAAAVLSTKPTQTFQLDFSAPAPVQHEAAPASPAPTKPTPKTTPVVKPQPRTAVLHGNPQSKIFHYASCRYYTCKLCTVILASVQEARTQGYRACSRCGKGK